MRTSKGDDHFFIKELGNDLSEFGALMSAVAQGARHLAVSGLAQTRKQGEAHALV
jgi:hypothetical protein